MYPIRCPVRSNVTSVAPDGAHFHSTNRLPYILAGLYVFLCINNLHGLQNLNGLRNRGLGLVDFRPYPNQGGEG